MWICFNDAFVSVTRDDNDPSRLMVRARNPEHLKALFGFEVKIKVTPDNDYHYRTFISRKTFADFVAQRLMDIDYGNFKASVKDEPLHDMYLDFWHTHYNYQADVERAAKKAARISEKQVKKEHKPGDITRQQPSLPELDPKGAMDKIKAIMNEKEE